MSLDLQVSGLLLQTRGVQVGHGPSLDLERLTLDVVAGDLLAGLADGDGLAALAADVDGLAVLLSARLGHHLLDGPLRYLERVWGSVVGLQVLHGFFTQRDDVHLLRRLRQLALQHADGVDLGVLSHRVALRNQGHILHVSRLLGKQRQSGRGRLGRLSVCRDEVDLLVLTRYEADVVPRHHQLDLLLGAEGGLVLLQLQDVWRLLVRLRPFRGGHSLLVVGLGVSLQIVQACEGQAAEAAGEGFLPRVGGDVSSPGARVREGLVADVAVEGFLSSVEADYSRT